jgi:hypothetical protein
MVHSNRQNPAEKIHEGPQWPINAENDLFTYEMLTARFLAHDEMLWQTPALALTAEAFLMTIALSRDVIDVAASIAAFLGFILMLMSMHLLGRHRFLELIEKRKLMDLEKRLGMEPLSTHSWAWKYAAPPRLGWAYGRRSYGLRHPRYHGVFSVPSYTIWQVGLGLFAMTNLAIIYIRLFLP